jgi:hypothetical protein
MAPNQMVNTTFEFVGSGGSISQLKRRLILPLPTNPLTPMLALWILVTLVGLFVWRYLDHKHRTYGQQQP